MGSELSKTNLTPSREEITKMLHELGWIRKRTPEGDLFWVSPEDGFPDWPIDEESVTTVETTVEYDVPSREEVIRVDALLFSVKSFKRGVVMDQTIVERAKKFETYIKEGK